VLVLPFIHLFALSLWSGLESKRHNVPLVRPRFFCASLVTMVFGFGSKPAPALVANGTKRQFSKEELNKATVNLQTALNKIANQHVLKYANAIRVNAKAQANAARATAVAAAAPTPNNVTKAVNAAEKAAAAQNNMIKTENAAKAAVNAAPEPGPVQAATLQAENAAVNAFIKAVANNNATITANVKWNNANKKWIKVNKNSAPGYNVNWNTSMGKNNKPKLIKIKATTAGNLPLTLIN